MGGGQNLEPQNVEQSIFRNFEIANIEITKNDSYILEFLFLLFINHLNKQNI